MSFLFMFHVNCLHVRILGLLSSQNKEAGPFVATQARFDPARTSFGKTGPSLGRTGFRVTVPIGPEKSDT